MNFSQNFRKNIQQLCRKNLTDFPYIEKYLLIPGKQIRPTLYLDFVSSQISSTTKLQKSDYDLASGLEILHLFFLVHDDIMDNDKIRRDQTTIHTYYSQTFGPVKGQGIGIAVGDLLFSQALKLFTENINNQQILPIIFDVIDTTAKGQVDEYLLNPAQLPKNCLTHILKYYEEKTALYSIYLPLALAYFQSSKSIDKLYLKNIRQLSKHLGIAFQINDDLIEFNLQKKRNSQNLCSDVLRGKITPILATILEKTPVKTAQQWIKEWQIGEVSRKSHDQILQAGHDLGAIEQAQQLIFSNQKKASHLAKKLGIINLPTLQLLFESLQ